MSTDDLGLTGEPRQAIEAEVRNLLPLDSTRWTRVPTGSATLPEHFAGQEGIVLAATTVLQSRDDESSPDGLSAVDWEREAVFFAQPTAGLDLHDVPLLIDARLDDEPEQAVMAIRSAIVEQALGGAMDALIYLRATKERSIGEAQTSPSRPRDAG